jgi:hypothetical protein
LSSAAGVFPLTPAGGRRPSTFPAPLERVRDIAEAGVNKVVTL